LHINFLELSRGFLDFESADLRVTDAAEFSERQSASAAVNRETAERWSDAIQEGLGAGVEIEQRISGSSWWPGEGLPGIGMLVSYSFNGQTSGVQLKRFVLGVAEPSGGFLSLGGVHCFLIAGAVIAGLLIGFFAARVPMERAHRASSSSVRLDFREV
jgi:hypothetical protein